jgi:chromosome partitioning protein
MRTIAVVARKGGAGKTTVAVHLALAAHLRGRKTMLADADPQGSSGEVMRGRAGDGPGAVEAPGRALAALQMTSVRQAHEAMVIDTPGSFDEAVTQAVAISDLVLVVVRPTFLDLAAALQTAEVVRKLRKPHLVVLNQAPPARDGIEPPAVKKALEALQVMRMPVAPTVLRSRAIYQTALETGRSAEESADVAAAREVGELWAFIERFAFAAPPASREPPEARAFSIAATR